MPYQNANEFREQIKKELNVYCRHTLFKPKNFDCAKEILSEIEVYELSQLETKSKVNRWATSHDIVNGLFAYIDKPNATDLFDILTGLLAGEFDLLVEAKSNSPYRSRKRS